MTWSGQRKRLREFVCPELRRRIDFHVTQYRKAHDRVGEAWIAVDDRKAFEAGYYKWWNAFHEARQSTQDADAESGIAAIQHGHRIETFLPKAEKRVAESGVYETGFFLDSTAHYLTLSLDEALASDNPIVKALALIDRRLGRRRFTRIDIGDDAPAIVKLFYGLRAEAMGW